MNNLPSMNKDKKNIKLPTLDYSVDRPSKYAGLQISDNYSAEFEAIERFMMNDYYVKEYNRIKEDYSNLIKSFNKSMGVVKDKKVVHDFNSLSEFEEAVSSGEFNISDYNISEISSLMNELEKLEESLKNRKLDEFNIKTTRDFYDAVDKGVLQLTKFTPKEISDFLLTLKDPPPLEIQDYSINFYGDVTIEEVYLLIEKREKANPSKLSKLSNNVYSKDKNMEIKKKEEELKHNLEEIIREKTRFYREDGFDVNFEKEEIYQKEVENIDVTFLEKISRFIGKLMNKLKENKLVTKPTKSTEFTKSTKDIENGKDVESFKNEKVEKKKGPR